MTSYNNPAIVPIPYAVGSDAVIETLRIKMGGLAWIEKVFGRAIVQHTAGDNGTDVTYPEVWGVNGEPGNVMMNDNLRAYCFFVGRDPETAAPYDPLQGQIYMRRPISMILWANLTKIDSTKKYRYSDFLKLQLFAILGEVAAFTFQNVYESHSRVFEGFTLTDTFKPYLKPPYWAIRVDGIISYPTLCENVSNYLLNDDGNVLVGDDGEPLISDQEP